MATRMIVRFDGHSIDYSLMNVNKMFSIHDFCLVGRVNRRFTVEKSSLASTKDCGSLLRHGQSPLYKSSLAIGAALQNDRQQNALQFGVGQ